MKKIMFNDTYGLTEAVLDGRKTMTRRIVKHPEEVEISGHKYLQTEKLRYKVGEVVAVAQSYDKFRWPAPQRSDFPVILKSAGWRNKMYVRADLMPHQIRITNVRVERLQDISDADCVKEGIQLCNAGLDYWYEVPGIKKRYGNPRTAFAALIDKVSGKGTWESNPWVFVFEFEIVK